MRSRTLIGVLLAVAAAAAAGSNADAQALTGWTDSQEAKRIAQFDTLTPEAVRDSATLKDDDLETVATLHTEKAFLFKGGFTDRVRSNTFLRALINKQTGRTIYQLYGIIADTGEWRTFEWATFATPDGPANTQLTIASHNVDCQYGVCVYTETIAFPVPEAFLRTLAEAAGQRPVKPWRFRLKAKSGLDWTDDMAPAEAAGILLAADRYRRDHKLP